MFRHIAITLAATLAACGLLIALPDSLTSQPVYAASVTSERAAECDAALADAMPELVVEYRELCAQGYAIEGASGRAYDADADACSETIMAELDTLQESTSVRIAGTPWQTIVADCSALGTDAAYVKYVGPALSPCVWEDGSDSALPCYWDAAARGNREGSSYIVTTAP